jgi:hypothetical protein
VALALFVAVALAGAARAALPSHHAPRPGTGAASDSPVSRVSLPRAGEFALSGAVLERLDASRYVYLRVRDNAGREAWVVTLRRGGPTPTRVDAWVVARAASFDSPRLHRRFSPLFFGIVRASAPIAAAQGGHS